MEILGFKLLLYLDFIRITRILHNRKFTLRDRLEVGSVIEAAIFLGLDMYSELGTICSAKVHSIDHNEGSANDIIVNAILSV